MLNTLWLFVCVDQVEAKQLSGRSHLSVPGYDHKVEFGNLYTFAYPVDGEGECEHHVMGVPLFCQKPNAFKLKNKFLSKSFDLFFFLFILFLSLLYILDASLLLMLEFL